MLLLRILISCLSHLGATSNIATQSELENEH